MLTSGAAILTRWRPEIWWDLPKPACKLSSEILRPTPGSPLGTVGTEREIVLLEAVSETALRRTHQRYFESLPEGVKSLSARGFLSSEDLEQGGAWKNA